MRTGLNSWWYFLYGPLICTLLYISFSNLISRPTYFKKFYGYLPKTFKSWHLYFLWVYQSFLCWTWSSSSLFRRFSHHCPLCLSDAHPCIRIAVSMFPWSGCWIYLKEMTYYPDWCHFVFMVPILIGLLMLLFSFLFFLFPSLFSSFSFPFPSKNVFLCNLYT